MRLFFGGAEVPGWRNLLADNGVEDVALSYWGLRRKTTFKRPYVISEKFEPGTNIFLDSGAYSVNSAAEPDKYSIGDLKDINAHYMAFADSNLDRLEMVSEFDALVLGLEWIKAMREDYWNDLPADKFLPIWHTEWGIGELDEMCQQYDRVGISGLGDGRTLVPTLNGMVQKYGTKLHGVAMTRVDEMSSIRWDSVASTSWLSPSMYGDTIVWTGKELKRYPKKYKDRSRKQHRTLFTREGFDAAKIEADDTTEILRLSIWSWKQLVDDIERHKGKITYPDESGSNSTQDQESPTNVQTSATSVGMALAETRNSTPTILRPDEERQMLPGMGLVIQRESQFGPAGEVTEVETPHLAIRSQSMRMCDTCFLAAKCPGFLSGANCLYDIPVTVQTPGQIRALQNGLIERQTQRVMFMSMAEDIEGGYADPNLSSEMDRLQKMIKTKVELESDGFSLKIEAKGRHQQAGVGLISRIFGSEAGNAAHQLPAPVPADDMAHAILGEIVEE